MNRHNSKESNYTQGSKRSSKAPVGEFNNQSFGGGSPYDSNNGPALEETQDQANARLRAQLQRDVQSMRSGGGMSKRSSRVGDNQQTSQRKTNLARKSKASPVKTLAPSDAEIARNSVSDATLGQMREMRKSISF